MAQAEQFDDGTTPDAPGALAQPVHATPSPQRNGLIGGLLGGVLAAGAGFALAQYVPNGWPMADTSAVEARLVAQEKAIDALRVELGRVASAPVAVATDPALAMRISAVEDALGALPPRENHAELAARLIELDARLAAIEAPPAGGVPVSVAALAAMTAKAQAQSAALMAEAERATQSARTEAALGQIRAALQSGAPFAAALGDLGTAVPQVLTESADAGLPTLTSLRDGFPLAARAALEAAFRANIGENWADRVGNFLRSQTGARSLTPRQGNDPDAILSRAEAALAGEDIATALGELTALPPEAQAKMDDWRVLAERRLAALTALADLAKDLGE